MVGVKDPLKRSGIGLGVFSSEKLTAGIEGVEGVDSLFKKVKDLFTSNGETITSEVVKGFK